MNWTAFSLLFPRLAQDYLIEMVMPGQQVNEFMGPETTDTFHFYNGKLIAKFEDSCHIMCFELQDGGTWEEIMWKELPKEMRDDAV